MIRKFIAAIMSATMVLSIVSVFAQEPVLISSNETAVEKDVQKYIQFAIEVKSATQDEVVADIDGVDTTFKITNDTIIVSKTKDMPKEGDKFVAIVEANAPAPLIYPPIYTAFALVRTEASVFAGKVLKSEDDKLKSEDGSIEFTVGETGYSVEDLENEEVIIVYSRTTYSIPPIAVADMIVVLDEFIDEDDENIDEEEDAKEDDYLIFDVEVTAVEDKKISGKFGEDEAIFNLNENTLLVSKTKDNIAVGEFVKIVIDADSPMQPASVAIYNPLAIVRGENNLYVGEFDKEDGVLVSEDNSFALNLEGTSFDEKKLDDNDLLVVYGESTKSIPQIATPEFIAVLKDNKADFAKALKDRADEKKKNQDTKIEVYVDRKPIDFSKYSDVFPFVEDNRTLIPIRAIAEALGCEVEFDDSTKLITIKNNKITIELTLDSDVAKVNGEEKKLEKEAKAVNDRTMVPARFVSENMGRSVDWDQNSLSVIIY